MVENNKNSKQIKVIFIAGWGRSGSTLLDNILGEVNGIFSLGELRYIWDRGLVENKSCGCGQPFRFCEFWSAVIDETFGHVSQEFFLNLIKQRDAFPSRAILWKFIPGGHRLLPNHLSNYAKQFEKLFLTLSKRTGHNIFVDSSKFPSHGYILEQIPSVQLYIVHLIRDPRAVAFSWTRKKVFDSGPDKTIFIDQHGLMRSSWLWNTWNTIIEMSWASNPRYLQMRYEDFIQDPHSQVQRIINLVDEENLKNSVTSDHSITLSQNHTVSGNPNRFKSGEIKLKLDQEWQTKMKFMDRIGATLFSWPLLLRYHYPILK